MDKKTLPIVILLAVIIIFYWQILEFTGLYEPQPRISEPSGADTAVHQATTPVETGIRPGDLTLQAAPQAPVTQDMTPFDTAGIKPDTVVVRTSKYEVLLSSFGGGPIAITLQDYTYRNSRLIEMLPGATSATPDALFADNEFGTSSLSYIASLSPGTYDVSGEPLELTYRHLTPSGGEIFKQFTFYPEEYHYDLRLQVNNAETLGFERYYTLMWNTPLGVTEPDPKTDFESMEAVAMQSGSRLDLDDFDDGRLHQQEDGNASWVGVRAKYFAAVMIPMDREAEAVVAEGIKSDVATADGRIETRRITAGLKMPIGATTSIDDRFRVFVGPLDYSLMADYGVGLEDMLGIGTTPVVGILIKPFAIAIMWFLPRMYSILPNYGIVIILFAFLVKLITLPLSMKSFKSMNAMKELQPRIEQLKERYKKNPQQLQKETMALYKKHGVNPVSGCLPILPQMPLFFALFSVFRSTILLRDAPFIWFIDDLSRGARSFTDPYIILVVLMVVTQFVSQKLTMPSSQQNKIFLYIMPLFMGYIFYSFAAGLVLYWTCFSLFSLLDYFLFKRKKNVQVKTA